MAVRLSIMAVFCVAFGGLVFGNPATPEPSQRERATPVTFAKDIAPIVFQQCAACHRPGGSAPFSLLTYAEIRPRMRQVVEAVTRRSMPPWAPEPGYGEFEGARRLTEEQIRAFQQWIDGGGLGGDLDALPPAPEFKDGWRLGKPDIVVKLPQPFRLPPGGPDRLRNFVLPISIPGRRYVRAWEFQTSNLQVVHHSMMMVDRTRATRARDESDPEPGYEGLIPLSAQMPGGYFADWTPGQVPYVAPDQMAWTLETDSDLVLTLHLRPTNAWETVEASVGLYFADAPPTRWPAMIRLSRQDIDIPAGEPRYTIADSYVLPVDIEAFDIKPHAHHLAKQMQVFADLPDGTKRWLISIRNWDFHWQDSYRYASPIALPAGTRITMEYTYDNSAANRANRNSPPKRITFGQETSNEMGDLWLQVLPRNPADLMTLTSSMHAKTLPQDITGYEMMLKADPDNVTLHNDVAGLYVEAGDFRNAARHSAESIRLKPGVAASHYSLGYNLLQLKAFDEAEQHFREALALDSHYEAARYGVGLTLWAKGKPEDAVQYFREAVRLSPESAGAHYNLGAVLQWSGKLNDAMASYTKAVDIDPSYVDAQFAVGLMHAQRRDPAMAVAAFRRVLELRQDWAPAQIQLAWLLATSSNPSVRDAKAALALAERSVTLTGQRDAAALDCLGAALAASGQFERAAAMVERAIALVGVDINSTKVAVNQATGDIDRMGARLNLYRNHQPYVEEP